MGFMKVLSKIGKVLNYIMIAILVMLGLPLFFSIIYGTTDSEEVFVFTFWLVFYGVMRIVSYVIKLLMGKKRGIKPTTSKRKHTTEDFIKSIVDEIIRTDSKIDISESSYISLHDVKKLKEYVPVFRLHLLLVMMTKASENVFKLSKRFSLLFETIESTCIKYGLTEEESKEFSKKVYDMQSNYENKIGHEKVHPEDIYFNACKYFVDTLLPDEPKASDKYLGTMKVVLQVHKHLNDIWNSVELLD